MRGGGRYDGDYLNGHKHGRGIETYSDGCR